jgi:uncharacterized protein
MRLVVDTNVFISGVFFSGPPHAILRSWSRDSITLVLSAEILTEYQVTGNELAAKFPEVDLSPWLELVVAKGIIVDPAPLPEQVCTDPDDDKFLACALAARTRYVTSGDRALVATSGYRGITVLTPRQFVDRHLR